MVPTDTPRKRMRFLVIALMILTLSAGTADAATKIVAKTPVKKTATQVKGEKITANKISVVGDNTISTYKVKDGDTLSGIAQKFDISVNTIRWSNDINSKDTIKPGETLTILPTSGVIYTVKSGDTLSGIAVKFNADQQDILNANDLDNADSLKIGMKLVIPEAEPLDDAASDSSVPDTTAPPQNISPIPVPVPVSIPAPATDSNSSPQIQTPAVVSPVVSSEAPGTTMMVTNPVTTETYSITQMTFADIMRSLFLADCLKAFML